LLPRQTQDKFIFAPMLSDIFIGHQILLSKPLSKSAHS